MHFLLLICELSDTSTLRVIQGSIQYGYNRLLCEYKGSGVSEWAVCYFFFVTFQVRK